MMRRFTRYLGLGLTLMILAAGCTHPTRPANPAGAKAYPYAEHQGPSVDEEIKFYRERCAQRPDSFLERNFLAGAYLTKAQNTHQADFYQLARQTAEESLKLMPTMNPNAELILASVREAQHDFPGALEVARRLYAEDPSQLGARTSIAGCLLEMGQLEEGQLYVDRLVAQLPTSSTLNLLARLQMARGQDEQAETNLKLAVANEQPQERKVSARSRALLGELYLRRGRLDEAESWLEESRKIDSKNPVTLADLAQLAEARGKPAQAEELYTQAYAVSQNPALLRELARLQAAAGQTEAAARLRKQAIEALLPEISAGGYGHARDLARLYLDEGDEESLHKAVSLLEHERKRRQDVKTLLPLAEAYQLLKQPEQALAVYHQALDSGLQDPDLLLSAAKAERAAGHGPQADELEKKAHQINPDFVSSRP